jgi:hypothetical protein
VAELKNALKKLDRLTQEEARIAFAEVLRATHNIRGDVKAVDRKAERVEITDQKVEGVDEWVQHDDVKVDSEAVDDNVPRRSVDSKEQGPPSLASHPIPPPPALGGRLHSFGVRELSPVRNAATKTTQPINSIDRAAPQSTTGARARLAPATSAPAQFSFATLTPSRSPTFPAGVGNKKADGDGAIAPSSTWWNNLKRKRRTPSRRRRDTPAHVLCVRFSLLVLLTLILCSARLKPSVAPSVWRQASATRFSLLESTSYNLRPCPD